MKLTDKKIILAINTAAEDESAVFLFDGFKITKEKIRGQKDKLLFLIDKVLRKRKKTAKDIRGIIVVSGPGSFTAVRQGVVSANAFGYLLGVPVVGVKLDEFKNENEFLKLGYEKMTKAKKGTVVLPAYGREPNITKPKKWKL
ncbi:hypothetical protein HZB93_02040 [Candidatus Falkowbacteria bacterium]|nr:hypothetical protein [Candidatus Falkowbacteria bacterium]